MGVENPITNLKYTIDNPDVISLVNGRITALKKGTAAIHITFEETLTELGSTATVNVTVIAKATRAAAQMVRSFFIFSSLNDKPFQVQKPSR